MYKLPTDAISNPEDGVTAVIVGAPETVRGIDVTATEAELEPCAFTATTVNE